MHVIIICMNITLQVLNLLCKLTDQAIVRCPDGVVEEIVEYTLSIMYVNNFNFIM